MKTSRKPSYEANRRRAKARSRAFHRLAKLHRGDFARLLYEEMAYVETEAAYDAEQATQAQHGRGVENYLFVGGPNMTTAQAADRLGVTPKSVERYKATLREAS